jgi:hypothetical protein
MCGRQQPGRKLWYEQEELTHKQMHSAEEDYMCMLPRIVLSHDAPTHIARLVWDYCAKLRHPNLEVVFRPSRTNAFLARLLERHAPRLWVFGHHHHDWMYREADTHFVCVGEPSYVDVNTAGDVLGP